MDSRQPNEQPSLPHNGSSQHLESLYELRPNHPELMFQGPGTSTVTRLLEQDQAAPPLFNFTESPPGSAPGQPQLDLSTAPAPDPSLGLARASLLAMVTRPPTAPPSFFTDEIYLNNVEEREYLPTLAPSQQPHLLGTPEIDDNEYRKENINQYERYDSTFRHLPGLDPALPFPPAEIAYQARMQDLLTRLKLKEHGLDTSEVGEMLPDGDPFLLS